MITEKDQEIIDEIMDNFDFHRCHRVMEFLDWTYSRPDNGNFVSYTPSIADLRKTARSLLKSAIKEINSNKEQYLCKTGGFVVTALLVDGINIYLNLSFEITEWNNYE